MHPHQRLSHLQTMLSGRVDGAGTAKKGFTRNVKAIRAEIARLTGGMSRA